CRSSWESLARPCSPKGWLPTTPPLATRKRGPSLCIPPFPFGRGGWGGVGAARDHEEEEVGQRGASGSFIGAKQRDVPGAVVGAGLWRSRSRKRSRIVARVEAPGSTNGQASQSSPRCGQVG